jgi:hypothetical protein
MGERRELQKMKNSGNEAKKYLKTKENLFFECAIYVRFSRKLARIRALIEQKQHILQNRTETSRPKGKVEQMTISRLVSLSFA